MGRAVGIAIALLLLLTACGLLEELDDGDEDRQTPEPIPSGAQQIQITLTPHDPKAPRLTDVTLTPDTVRAGEVYIIAEGWISFVERKAGPDATPGPLTDRQVSKITRSAVCPRGHADCLREYVRTHPDVLKDTWVTNVIEGYCDSREDPAAHGTGLEDEAYCQYLRVDLRPGRYLIMHGGPPTSGAAVLTVTP
jgi:hypothetical protein